MDQPVAEVRGLNIYAKQLVDGRDRKQLERLCRYGTRGLLLDAHDLIARLVAAIPPPPY